MRTKLLCTKLLWTSPVCNTAPPLRNNMTSLQIQSVFPIQSFNSFETPPNWPAISSYLVGHLFISVGRSAGCSAFRYLKQLQPSINISNLQALFDYCKIYCYYKLLIVVFTHHLFDMTGVLVLTSTVSVSVLLPQPNRQMYRREFWHGGQVEGYQGQVYT